MLMAPTEDVHVAADQDIIPDLAHSKRAAAANIHTGADSHLRMSEPSPKSDTTIPAKGFQAHEVEPPPKEYADHAWDHAEYLRTGQKEVVTRANCHADAGRYPQRRCEDRHKQHKYIT